MWVVLIPYLYTIIQKIFFPESLGQKRGCTLYMANNGIYREKKFLKGYVLCPEITSIEHLPT